MRSLGAALVLLTACNTAPERVPVEVAAASEYCELSADMFCDYYLRCDRMAAETHAECRSTFAEACNNVYEPHYVRLEERGELELSVAGLAACADHLQDVACDEQINDLDGACADVWTGLAPDGAACGLGIESFVCGAESTCVLGLDFCGTCEPTVPAGSACGADVGRCADGTSCIADVCVADAKPGETCGDERDCVVGSRCEDGTCQRTSIVGIGEDCGQVDRCQYRAACVDGSCVQAALLGDACSTELPCASGWCDAGVCVPQTDDGACTSGLHCYSGICDEGTCMPLPGVCF